MNRLLALIKRNIALFFRDKGMFFTSLITPVILLVLYVSFLASVYRDSFASNMPEGLTIPEDVLDGLVGGQLLSSLLAVCCVTVSFCSNMLMVQDKVTGARRDFTTSPLKPATLAMSYFLATVACTLVICLIATGAGMAYLGTVGWFLSVSDVLLLLLDVLLLVLFGTALSSVIHHFLSTQGQISAVGTVVSSGYGFICGAYMPISQFSPILQKVLSFLPGTYGTVLLRNHAMQGALSEMESLGFPEEVVQSMADVVDCNLYFFGEAVSMPVMYAVLGGNILLLMAVYIAIQCHTARNA